MSKIYLISEHNYVETWIEDEAHHYEKLGYVRVPYSTYRTHKQKILSAAIKRITRYHQGNWQDER